MILLIIIKQESIPGMVDNEDDVEEMTTEEDQKTEAVNDIIDEELDNLSDMD